MTSLLALGLGGIALLWAAVDWRIRRGQTQRPVATPAALTWMAQAAGARLRPAQRPEAGLVLGDLRPSGQETCTVCGEPIHGRRVRCADCRTPHHAECWAYAGSCAIYGCGSDHWSA